MQHLLRVCVLLPTRSCIQNDNPELPPPRFWLHLSLFLLFTLSPPPLRRGKKTLSISFLLPLSHPLCESCRINGVRSGLLINVPRWKWTQPIFVVMCRAEKETATGKAVWLQLKPWASRWLNCSSLNISSGWLHGKPQRSAVGGLSVGQLHSQLKYNGADFVSLSWLCPLIEKPLGSFSTVQSIITGVFFRCVWEYLQMYECVRVLLSSSEQDLQFYSKL